MVKDFMDWKECAFKVDHNGNEELRWSIATIPKPFKSECLIEEGLWVVHNYTPDENGYCWMSFAFLEFSSWTYGTPKDTAELSMLMHGEGPAGFLRECRHTYWGEDGYIFYPNKKHIDAAMQWLSKYYDLT